MKGYDSWLLAGSDDCPPDELSLRGVIRANKKHPYEFGIEGDEDGRAYMFGNTARWCSVPNNAKAIRIRYRIFNRLNKRYRRARAAYMAGVSAWLE